MLRDRVLGATQEVRKVTPFYMICVRNDSPKPRVLSPDQQAKRFADLHLSEKVCYDDLPRELRAQSTAAQNSAGRYAANSGFPLCPQGGPILLPPIRLVDRKRVSKEKAPRKLTSTRGLLDLVAGA